STAGRSTAPAGVDTAETGDVEDAADAPSRFVAAIETDLGSSDGAAVMRAAAAEVPWLAYTSPELLAVLNDFGTAVYNFFTDAVQFLAGPARAPFGSRVRVESSTLTLGDGVVVPVDWYFPTSRKAPTGLIYLQHGFLATAAFYSATAAYLAEKTNSIVVAPTLTWNTFDIEHYPLVLPRTHRAIADLLTGNRAELLASARTAGFRGTLPTRLVLAGHSMGGGLVTGVAARLVELGEADDLAGVLMLDGASYLDLMSTDLAKIPRSIPVYNLAGEPYYWNTFGDANIRLAQARPGMFTGVVIEGGLHSDSMQSSSPAVQFAAYLATGFSSPWNVITTKVLAAGWVKDMLAGTHTARLYGSVGSAMTFLSGWWPTSAQVLPAHSAELSLTDRLYACLLNPTTVSCTSLLLPSEAAASREVSPAKTMVAVA
ncbi:alpha/beta hydrolase, partial [Mycolicibacterium sp.]